MQREDSILYASAQFYIVMRRDLNIIAIPLKAISIECQVMFYRRKNKHNNYFEIVRAKLININTN